MLLQYYYHQDTGGIVRLSEALCQESVRMGFLVKLEHPNISVGGGTVHLYFQPKTAAALKRIAEKKPITINTGFRTLAQQYVLKRNLTTLVAPIGRSDHGAGRSVDIENWKEVKSLLISEGFVQPYPSDLVHWDYPEQDYRDSAVRAFQNYHNRYNENKLTSDGVMGQATLNALGKTPTDGYQGTYGPLDVQKAFQSGDYEYGVVLAFQKLVNGKEKKTVLTEDGVIGEKTLAAYSSFKWDK